MAIAMIEVSGFDAHLQLALCILRVIAEHNSGAADAMRRFEVRIGINENVDNVLPDINERRNVAGSGISMAQRIMDKADAGQVLVGQSVYEVLRQRENYLSSFRAFTATGKHGMAFPLYQFLSKDASGLNVAVPSAFAPKKIEPRRLTKLAAYYVAHAVKNRAFLLSRRDDPGRDHAATVLLAFLAEDSVQASETPAHEVATPITWRAGVASFEEQYKHYYDLDYWPLARLAGLLEVEHLGDYSEHFETSNYSTSYSFVRPSGVEKLQADWPEIATEFGLSAADDKMG